MRVMQYLGKLWAIGVGLLLVGTQMSCSYIPFLNQSEEEAPAPVSVEIPSTQENSQEALTAKAPVSGDADKLFRQGVQYGEAKNWAAAITAYQKALALDPNHVSAQANLGWALAETKKWDAAAEELKKAIKLDPNHAGAHTNLAWAYAELGKWDQVISESQRAIQLDPKNGYAYANLGWGYSATGLMDKALRAYEKSVELNPDMDSSYYALGLGYCDQGKKSEAHDAYKQLTRLSSPHATDLYKKLQDGCRP